MILPTDLASLTTTSSERNSAARHRSSLTSMPSGPLVVKLHKMVTSSFLRATVSRARDTCTRPLPCQLSWLMVSSRHLVSWRSLRSRVWQIWRYGFCKGGGGCIYACCRIFGVCVVFLGKLKGMSWFIILIYFPALPVCNRWSRHEEYIILFTG